MVRKLKYFTIITSVLSSVIAIYGDVGDRSPFAIGMGARQLAMGGATVGFINSSGSVYWNPAGLALLERPQVQLFHMSLFMDTRYQFLSAAFPTIAAGGFGIGIGDISSGDFERIQDYSKVGEFSSRQDLFLVGYGFSPIKKMLTGVVVKGVYFDIADYKSTGFGFDLGMIYFPPLLKEMSFGLKLSDIGGPRVKLHRLDQRFPWSFRGGLSYSRMFSESYGLVVNADIEKTENNPADIYAGGELGIKDMVFARFGYMADKITIGAGISYYNFRFDYAYTNFPDLGASNRFSLNIAFGTPVEIKKAQREESIAQERILELRQEQEQENLDKLQKELANAHEFEQKGEIYRAIEAYYKVLGLDDQNSEARQKVSLLLNQIRTDITQQAGKEYIDELVNRQLQLGNNYYDKKQYDKAAEQFEFALIHDPENQVAKEKLGDIDKIKNERVEKNRVLANEHMRNGDYERALSALNEILQLVPDDKEAISKRAEVYRMIESSKYLDEAIKLFNWGEYEKAAVQVDSALILNPTSEGARSLKIRLAEYIVQQTTLEDIKANDKHWQTYIQGMEKYQAGEYEQALNLWRSLLEYYPNNPNLKRNIDQAKERSLKK